MKTLSFSLKTLVWSLCFYGLVGFLFQTLQLFSFQFSLPGILFYALGGLLYSFYVQEKKVYLLLLAAIFLTIGFVA